MGVTKNCFTVSLWLGLLIVLLAFWVDIRTRHDKDFAFWLYLFGIRCETGVE